MVSFLGINSQKVYGSNEEYPLLTDKMYAMITKNKSSQEEMGRLEDEKEADWPNESNAKWRGTTPKGWEKRPSGIPSRNPAACDCHCGGFAV